MRRYLYRDHSLSSLHALFTLKPMSQATSTRSLTPSIEVQRLTDPNTLAYKYSTLRIYSSADKLGGKPRSIRTPSSSTPQTAFRVDYCCPSQADLALNPQPVETKSAMLSNFFHPTKATVPPPQKLDETTGDFDETPLPSLRPSMADMSPKKLVKDTASSVSSTRSGAFRHALLKTASGRPMIIEKDLPVAPILIRQIHDGQQQEEQNDKGGYENKLKIAIPSRKYSPTQLLDNAPPPDDRRPIDFTTSVDQPFPRERVCVDPLIHPEESHIKAHHRGLLKGADFCDAGMPGQPVAQLPEVGTSSSSSSSSASSEAEVVLARVRRAMTGDDLCLSTVEVTVPKHDGHSHAIKVRPAFNMTTFQYPNATHRQEAFLGISKVRSFDPSKEHLVSQGDIVGSPVSEHDREASASMSVSKGRPSAEVSLQSNHPAGHQPDSKSQAFDNELYSGAEGVQEETHFIINPEESAKEDQAKGKKSRPPSAVRSRAGTLDYKNTAQWLRDLLKNPGGDATKLTEMPSKRSRTSSVALKVSPEHSPISRKITRQSTLPPSDIEPGIFQSTFGELERLLHEALALASQVADEEEAKSPGSGRPPHFISHRMATPTIPDNDAQPFSDIDLNDSCLKPQPTSKRAATFPNIERPAIGDVSDLYRNISLTPQTAELKNMLARYTKQNRATKKTKRRRKSRSRQACPVPERISSRRKTKGLNKRRHTGSKRIINPLSTDSDVSSMDGSDDTSVIDFSPVHQGQNRSSGPIRPRTSAKRVPFISRHTGENILPERDLAGRPIYNNRGISLRGKSHVSLRGVQAFSLAKSKRRQPIARDWSPIRKRAIASVACISTALVGIILGVYAGLVPSLQYYILDTSHATINGNVGCFLGMAFSTFFCWPLPLMHGRKPYITSSLILTMPLLFPQALAVSAQRFYSLTG